MSTSQAQDGLPEPDEHDYPLHLLAAIPGITPWALLPGTYAGLRAALDEARRLAGEHGWTVRVNDRHGVHWRTRTPPGPAAQASRRSGTFAASVSGLAPRAGEPDPAEAEAASSPWRVHSGPAPYKQRTLTDGFAGQCGPDPQQGDGRWSWSITDPYTGSGRLSSGTAADEAAAERAIADWETTYTGGAYDPISDLAALIDRSIQQLRSTGLGADAAAVLRRLCRRLGIGSDQPADVIEARLRGGLPASQAGPAGETGHRSAALIQARSRYPVGPCPTCRGTGARPGTSPRICPACDGAVRHPGRVTAGNPEPCGECHGRGRIVDDPCPDCSGSGQERSRQNPQTI